jgi:hypothetical protein
MPNGQIMHPASTTAHVPISHRRCEAAASVNSATSAAGDWPSRYAPGRVSAKTMRGQRRRPNSASTPSAHRATSQSGSTPQ